MTQPAPLSEIPLEKIHATNRQAKFMFASMGSSLIAYAVVANIIRQGKPVAEGGILGMIFVAVAVMTIFAATLVKSLLLRDAPPTGEARLARLWNATVVSAAMCELPAILGFVHVFITNRTTEFYPLLVVSAYMLARHFPRREAWETYVRRGSNAR